VGGWRHVWRKYYISSDAFGRMPSKICRFARSVSSACRRDNGKPIIAPQRGPDAHLSAAAGSAFQSAASCWSPETLPSCTKTFRSRRGGCQTWKARRRHYISSIILKTYSCGTEVDDVTHARQLMTAISPAGSIAMSPLRSDRSETMVEGRYGCFHNHEATTLFDIVARFMTCRFGCR
jgi:hypothetical protein